MPKISFAALSPEVKKVLTIHDLSFERFPEFLSLKRRLWHDAVFPRALCEEADKVVAVSRSTARELRRIYGLPRQKVETVYSGLDPVFRAALSETRNSDSGNGEKFGNDEKVIRAVREKYDLPEEFILFLGTLEPRKNVEGMILAFGRVLKMLEERRWRVSGVSRKKLDPNVPAGANLVIAGARGWSDKKMFALANRPQAAGRVKFIGYVPPEDKLALYRAAKVFAFPSFYEGFGFPPLEAMAAGTPVVAGANSALVEIVGKGGVLVDPHNTEDIAEAIFQLLTDEALRRRMIKEGRRQAEKFSWREAAGRMIEIFEKAVN